MHYLEFKTISPIELASEIRGGSRISGEGVYMYSGVEVRFADFFSLIYHENEIIWSQRDQIISFS